MKTTVMSCDTESGQSDNHMLLTSFFVKTYTCDTKNLLLQHYSGLLNRILTITQNLSTKGNVIRSKSCSKITDKKN